MLAVERDVKPRNMNFAKVEGGGGAFITKNTVVSFLNELMKSRYVCTWSANVGDINRNKLRFGYSGMRCRIRISIQGSGTRISGYPLRSLL